MQTVEFPVYGLAGWDGPRWLSMVDGPLGGAVSWLTLAHQSPGGRGPWAVVMSGRPVSRGKLRWEEDVAGVATHQLFNLTLPDPGVRPEGLLGRAARFMFGQAERWSSWTSVDWTVDDEALQAAVLPWSGAWGGFVRSAKMGVVVVAADVPRDGLSLVSAGDGRDYHCDLLRPIRFPDDLQASRAAALGRSASFYERERPPHPDMDNLVD